MDVNGDQQVTNWAAPSSTPLLNDHICQVTGAWRSSDDQTKIGVLTPLGYYNLLLKMAIDYWKWPWLVCWCSHETWWFCMVLVENRGYVISCYTKSANISTFVDPAKLCVWAKKPVSGQTHHIWYLLETLGPVVIYLVGFIPIWYVSDHFFSIQTSLFLVKHHSW